MKKKTLTLAILSILAFPFLLINNAFAADYVAPTINIVEPTEDMTVSINDPISVKVRVVLGDGTSHILSWTCSEPSKLSAGYTCPANNTEEANIAYKAVGTYSISLKATDNNNVSGEASFNINVVPDLPIISAATSNGATRFAPGSEVTIRISAEDAFGTVNRLEWGCTNGVTPDFDSNYDSLAPSSSLSRDFSVILPDEITENYTCIFRATDDDDLQSEIYTLKLSTFIQQATEDEGVLDKTVGSPDTGAMVENEGFSSADIAPFIVFAFVLTLIAGRRIALAHSDN